MSEQNATAPSADATDAVTIPAPDPKSAISRALVALHAALDAATSAAVGPDTYAAAIADMSKHVGLPGIDTAILALERQRELSQKSARETAAAAVRAQYGPAFDAIARYGLPTAPVKPGRANKSAGTVAPEQTPITDADGHVYSKSATLYANYTPAESVACGSCPISESVAQAATGIKLANLRQNATGKLALMSTADVSAHAACFAAYADAQHRHYPSAATIVSYVA